jgi:hypothetical protein
VQSQNVISPSRSSAQGSVQFLSDVAIGHDPEHLIQVVIPHSISPRRNLVWWHAVAYLVEALCYKPEGSQWGYWMFSVDLIHPAVLWPRSWLSVEYKWVAGIFLGIKRGRRVRLKSLRHLWADWLENVVSSTSQYFMLLHGLLQE